MIRTIALSLAFFGVGIGNLSAQAHVRVAEREAPIPIEQLGEMAGRQYDGNGLRVERTDEGAELVCLFQRLEGGVGEDGLWLRSSAEGQESGLFKVRATAVGRPESAMSALAPQGHVEVAGGVAKWIRPGVVEEYSVSMDGVRQDFLVLERPSGVGELTVNIAFTGAAVQSSTDGIVLIPAGTTRELAYSRLRVFDATDRVLDARMEVLAADRIAVHVDDRGAVYPVRIDPTISNGDRLQTEEYGTLASSAGFTAVTQDAGFTGYWGIRFHHGGSDVWDFRQNGSSIIFNGMVEGTVEGNSFDITVETRYVRGTIQGDTIDGTYRFEDEGHVDEGTWVGSRIPDDGSVFGQGTWDLPVSRNWTPAIAVVRSDSSLRIQSHSSDGSFRFDFADLNQMTVGSHQVKTSWPDPFFINCRWREHGTEQEYRNGQSGSITITRFDTRLVGYYEISFNVNPDDNLNLTGTFDVPVYNPFGSVQVNLGPSGALPHKPQWRIADTGSRWFDSGQIYQASPTGNQTIEFRRVFSWLEPAPRATVITEGELSIVNIDYTPRPIAGIYTGVLEGGMPDSRWVRDAQAVIHDDDSVEFTDLETGAVYTGYVNAERTNYWLYDGNGVLHFTRLYDNPPFSHNIWNSTDWFYGNDASGSSRTFGLSKPSPDPADAPVLSWTGEAGYEADGVEPNAEWEGFEIRFRIHFNDTPATGYPKLHLRKNGQAVAGSPFTLSNRGDSIYGFDVSTLAPGEYEYRFEAQDTSGQSATGAPTEWMPGPDIYALGEPIEILSPTVESLWQVGQSHTIEWNMPPGFAAVAEAHGLAPSSYQVGITYSTDDGATWNDWVMDDIGLPAGPLASVPGTYAWTIPEDRHDLASSESRIKIVDLSGGGSTAISERFIVSAHPPDVQVVYPNTSTTVLAGWLDDGIAIPEIIFDLGDELPDYIVFEVATGSTASHVNPADRGDVLLNRWRVDRMGLYGSADSTGQYLALNALTQIRPYNSATFLIEAGVPWGVDQWRASRYTWTAYSDIGGEMEVGGEFSLGYVGQIAGVGRTRPPVVLLHGIGGRRNKWAKASDFTASLGSDRPVYVLEYPNTDDIRISGVLLGQALERICAAHAVARSHVLAHSMGGLVARYYQQHLASGVGNRMHRIFSLGSPFEGSAFAETGTADGWRSTVVLTLIRELGAFVHDLPAILNTIALQQISNPQADPLDLFTNDSGVAHSEDWLAGCGTQKGLLVANDILYLLANGDLAYLLSQSLTDEYLSANLGSDGVVSWRSALKRPLNEPMNLYYKANHDNYFSSGLLFGNRDYERMTDDIRQYFLLGMDSMAGYLMASPIEQYYEFVVSVQDTGNAYVGIGGETVRLFGQVMDAFGNIYFRATRGDPVIVASADVGPMSMRASGEIGALSGSDGETIRVFAPGYLSAAIGTQSDDGTVTIHTTEVDLQPDPDWELPRGGWLRINEGAVTTTSPTVEIWFAAENATEVAIFEVGADPVWESYGGGVVARTYSFADSALGSKTLFAAFRNAEGEGPAAIAEILLASPGQIGAITITDTVGGGARIMLNGMMTDRDTPATLDGLPPGNYQVSLSKSGVQWHEPVQTVTLAAGQTIALEFSEATACILGEALNAPDLTWTTGGHANWFCQSQTTRDGLAAQSGTITHNQQSWMQTTVTGPGTISFWWKASSESNYDFLRFYIGSTEQQRISGNVDWQQRSYYVPSGAHTLKWQYDKDRGVDAGSDCGWVDQVVWSPGAGMSPAGGGTISDRRPQFSWPAVAGATWYRLWVSRDGQTYLSEWVESATTWTPPTRGLPVGYYRWAVQPWAANTGYGAWFPTADFRITGGAPGLLTLISPTGPQTTHDLTYRWTKDANATWYRLWVTRPGDGTWHDRWYQMSGTGEGTATVNGHPGGTSEWWMQPWGPDGTGPWSGPRSFSTPDAAPAVPTLVSPVGTTTSPVTLQYQSARAEWFRVYVMRGDTVVLDRWTEDPTFNLGARPSGSYSWWVGAWNEASGRTVWSERREFWVQ